MRFVRRERRGTLAASLTGWGLVAITALALFLAGVFTAMTWNLVVGQEWQVLGQRIETVRQFSDAKQPDDIGLLHELSEDVQPPRQILLFVRSDAFAEVMQTDGFTDHMPWVTTPGDPDHRDGTLYTSPVGGTFLLRHALFSRVEGGRTLTTEIWASSNVSLDLAAFKWFAERAVLVTLVFLAAFGVATVYFVRRQLVPIRGLVDEIRALSLDDLKTELATDHLPQELHVLVVAYNDRLRRLRETITALSTYADNAAHELRGPVGRIFSLAERTLALEIRPAEAGSLIEKLAGEATQLRDLLNRVLFLARADNGFEIAHVKPVDVPALFEALSEVYAPYAEENGVVLTSTVDPALAWPSDSTFLRQILANLIENAIHHTPAGGAIAIAAQHDQSDLVITVRDTGHGISASDLAKVFQRFYRADVVRGPNTGAGLGLSIVAALVRVLRGTIDVDSELGVGTVFTMRLPVIGPAAG